MEALNRKARNNLYKVLHARAMKADAEKKARIIGNVVYMSDKAVARINAISWADMNHSLVLALKAGRI